MMFDSMRIQNFRGIKDLSLTGFKQINLFVGDNAIGKTTVLDALYIGINPNNPELMFRTNVFRKMDSLKINNPNDDFWSTFFYQFDLNNTIQLDFEGKVNREIEISPLRSTMIQNYIAVSENRTPNTTNDADPVIGLNFNFKVRDSSYSSRFFQKSNEVPQQLPDNSFVEDLKGIYLNHNTFTVHNLFFNFDNIVNSKNKKKLIHYLKTIEPTIEDVNRIETSIKIDDSRFSKAVDICTYGDGFFKSFYVISSILAHDAQYICLFDEIENGLYYSKQALVWKSMVSLLNQIPNEQVFVATHSREMITQLFLIAQKMDYLDKISLYRIEKNKQSDLQVFRYSASQFQYAMQENIEVR